MTAVLDSVNVGAPRANPHKEARDTGIDKRPTRDAVEVRSPGPKSGGLGSGLVGDFVGDRSHHGGDQQAVYSFQREDLDAWQRRLGRELPNGFFGENLTTLGIDVNEARLGEIWQLGETVRLRVTGPRIPCTTFRGWVAEKGWLRTFTLDARPGAYLSVESPGFIASGDEVRVIHRPDHDVTVSLVYRAATTEPELLPSLLAAGDDLDDEWRETVESGKPIRLG
jgi:MOSC domain-containing protein YiiM